MSQTNAEWAALIDDAVRGVPGVDQMYFAAPLPARLWRVATAQEGAYATVSGRDGDRDVVVSIGLAHERADDVARRVADRVRDVLADPTARVTVRVSRLAAH
jgi:hypothetical protein